MSEFGNALQFDYTDYSLAAVKLYLDSLHLITAGSTDITTVLECIDFAQFEGKTTYDSFEVDLVNELMDSIMNTTLPLGTELLISAFLHRVDNFDERYQTRISKKLTAEAVSSSVYEIDKSNAPNKQLVEMCVRKGVFEDDTQEAVTSTLMTYGKELQEFYAVNLAPSEVSIDDFRPDPRLLRYHFGLYCILVALNSALKRSSRCSKKYHTFLILPSNL